MGFGSWLSDVGDSIATGLRAGVNTVNALDPFNKIHYDVTSAAAPEKELRTAGVGLEAFGAGTQWVRTNVVSHPISTLLLQAKRAGTDPGVYFSTADWSSAWKAAWNVSPGQAALLGQQSFLNNPNAPLGAQQAEKAIASPLQYYKPAAADLPAGFDALPEDEQQRILREAGMPVTGNRYVEELRQSSTFYKNASGVLDFSLAWWADPTIVGGKLAVGARRARMIRQHGAQGWSTADIDTILNESTMVKTQKYILDNRDNPQLLNNLHFAEDSAMGPRFGHIASLLKDEEEVNLFLRVGMGDLTAMDRLIGKNKLVEGRLAQMNDRIGGLNLMRTRWLHNPNIQATIDQQIADLEARINADDLMKLRYSEILEHGDEIDKINLSRWGFARAEQKTEAQNAYRAGAAYGYKTERERVITPGVPLISRVGAPLATPIDGGMVKQRIWGLGDFFSTPVTVVRALKEANPNGWMRIDDITKDSVAELRAHVARIPNITAEARLKAVNDYLKTSTDGERLAYLTDLDNMAVAKIAEKHGMDPKAGQELHKSYVIKRRKEVENAKAYGASKKPGSTNDIRVDEFEDAGGRVVIHPHTVTRLANTHVLTPLDEFDKVLARHSSALSALRETRVGNPDWLIDGSEFLTSLFKVSVLARLGYIPRVIGDDLAGQWSAAGSAAMAARIGWGVRNGATNTARALAYPWQAAREQVQREGVKYADEEIKIAEAQNKALRAQLKGIQASNARDLARAQKRFTRAETRYRALDPADRSPKALAVRQYHQQQLSQLRQANSRVAAGPSAGRMAHVARQDQRIQYLTTYRDLAQRKADDLAKWRTVERQGDKPVVVDGITFPAAFGGKEGEYMHAQVSADESIGNIFASNKQLMHGNLMRSFDHGGRVIRTAEDEELHAQSWAHAINAQIMQDPLERMAVQGADVTTMKKWLYRDPAGKEYRRRIGLKLATPEALAQSAKHEVDDLLPDWTIRQAAMDGTLTPEFLKKAVPRPVDRPEVHTGMIGVQGQGGFQQGLDRIQQKWFNFAATIPSNRMSRHPLYNQLYEGHTKIIAKSRKLQGGFTVSDVDQMTTAARRLALRDMRKLVFDIAHRSDAAAAMRFISPFFSATAESFQRWGRIIADKPQVVGYAANFFNAPIAAGSMQDSDGNTIMQGGYRMVKDAKTGKFKKELVPKAERWIVGRMPHWLADSPVGIALGVEHSSGNFALSQNSMNLVTQGDPWFNPGVGPVVQIPVNELVKDKPSQAETARALGILPFGPQQGGVVGRTTGFVTSAPIKNFLTAFDTSDERYQAVKLQIVQRAAYEHDNLGKPMPSAQRIADMTREYWLFSAASAFSQPMATKRKDAFQFYRDQYNNLRRQDPQKADQNFLDRFGESYFVFAQAQSQNLTGTQATKRAFELSQEYAPLIAEHPELGALIVGPEGNGPFSPEVYSYQLNHPVTPGGSEMQRTKMSADEAMAENQRRLGWSKYMARMNSLNAKLTSAGFTSFEDQGAESLKQDKQNWTKLYAEPLYPDGSPNPYYNDEWSKDFYSFDVRKNDRMVAALTDLVRSDLADDPRRTDLRKLQEYLGGRQQVMAELNARDAAGGAKMLSAKANSDLSLRWGRFVDGLVESDTNFGDLYHRYLSRDLGVEVVEEES
jgi:hypothetical protein